MWKLTFAILKLVTCEAADESKLLVSAGRLNERGWYLMRTQCKNRIVKLEVRDEHR